LVGNGHSYWDDPLDSRVIDSGPCFDRLLLNGLIQPFQQPKRVIGFVNTYREANRFDS
jgi:hypothetical protein